MQAIKRVDADVKLEFLRATVTTWVKRLESVSKNFPQDQRSYYLESTLVGLLAGSAWANGLQAITEVKIRRTPTNAPERAGRLDLLMQEGERRVALEAKLIWDSEMIVDHVMGSLADACAEVISISSVSAQLLLGSVFFVPWWNHHGQKRNLRSMTIDRYDDLKADMKACYYDPSLEYPGAIFAARIASPR
jgi:hypothetical protein